MNLFRKYVIFQIMRRKLLVACGLSALLLLAPLVLTGHGHADEADHFDADCALCVLSNVQSALYITAAYALNVYVSVLLFLTLVPAVPVAAPFCAFRPARSPPSA